MSEISIGEFARRSQLSVKALHLYDELGVLLPARVDSDSGYRYYDEDQLDGARFIARLRQIDIPLANVKAMLTMNRAEAATAIAAYWQSIESVHDSRRDLAHFLVDQLRGKQDTMFDIQTRDVPERSLLCLKRHVDQAGAWQIGKDFINIFRERPMSSTNVNSISAFSIYWGQVSDESDGPVEWCRPIETDAAEELAAKYPELSLRIEPAHQEAFTAIQPGAPEDQARWQLMSEALTQWATTNGLDPEMLAIRPDELGVRITYSWTLPRTPDSTPDCDFAVPFVKR